jgi:hypothetical protein
MEMFINHDADSRITELKSELDKVNAFHASTFGKKVSNSKGEDQRLK